MDRNEYINKYNDKWVECKCGIKLRQANIYKHYKKIKHPIKVGEFDKLKLNC